MKTRFNTVDLILIINELKNKLVGMRVIQIYNVDQKAYLIRLSLNEEKVVLLIESGVRLHTTTYEWPKTMAPSSFAMKMRKHLKNKRLEKIEQLGMDRVVDLQFGMGEAAYHIILEMYDRGNICLTDYQYNIMNILRPRVHDEAIKLTVGQRYPVENARKASVLPTEEEMSSYLVKGKAGDLLRKILIPHLDFGPALIEHALIGVGFCENSKLGKNVDAANDVPKIMEALKEAEEFMNGTADRQNQGYIIQKSTMKKNPDGTEEVLLTYDEFHPFLYRQLEGKPVIEKPFFDVAVDDFFSNLESQKLELKAAHQGKEALRKLDNIKKDQEKRLEQLQVKQTEDKKKASLIELNLPLVDSAIQAILKILAQQLNWKEVNAMVKEAQMKGDPVAKSIKQLKLDINHITLFLSNPYSYNDDTEEEENEEELKPMLVDIDLALSAYANACKYYDLKRHAAKKEHKTMESSVKALKSAERKTKQTLKEVATTASINKARKVFFFEKFYWFISSENYVVLAGRDQHQNEFLVKKYLKKGDIYVHADLHGASSVIIKNHTKAPVPPKTLNEAGGMAVCYSSAWDARMTTNAWWVEAEQVSKTAPTGEYLTTGSFMIRGKKNYLPPCSFVMGFGFMFRLEDDSIERHKGERRVRSQEEDALSVATSTMSITEEEEEIKLSEGESDEEEEKKENQENLDSVKEETVTNVKEEEEDNESENSEDTDKDDEEVEEEKEDPKTESCFPDTVVELEYVGDKMEVKPRTVSVSSAPDDAQMYLGDNVPVRIPALPKETKTTKQKGKSKETKKNLESGKAKKNEEPKQPALKRGQKGKLKKIKEKYKDQTEEERAELAMIQEAIKKDNKRKKKKKEEKQKQEMKGKKKNLQPQPMLIMDETEEWVEPPKTVEEEDQEQSDEDDKADAAEALYNTLTGVPVAEDELLFAIPVCAPYAAIVNYKYKVKLTPGNGRRGKAAKTALYMFMKDKAVTNRERDLLRSVKDQDLARNLPGKVTVSAPQLKKSKKK